MTRSLPPECLLRRATSADMRAIRGLVFRAKLDPTQLRWQQFWIVECDDKVVACGQLRTFTDAQELGSLVVSPPWRRRGLGTFLARHLIEEATEPLYLECLGKKLAEFYRRLGFVPIAWEVIPRSLQFKFGLSRAAQFLLGLPLSIMHYSTPPSLQ